MVKKQKTLDWRVIEFIQKHNLLPAGEALIVSVSGGADSVCLLHILMKYQQELNVKLHIAHLDHQLRGTESERDAKYVSDLSIILGIPATIESRDVTAYRDQKGCSLEEAAREVRYNYLAEVARNENAGYILVGHTRNDQVETILMHILRGTGIAGLCGLQPKSKLQIGDDVKHLNIIRPLLDSSRKETESYCQQYNLDPRIDSSNLSLDFLRNRIRHELLPELKNYNPAIEQALLRLADIAAGDISFIEEQASLLWSEVANMTGNAVYLDKHRITALSVAMQRQLFRTALYNLAGTLKDIEAEHIEAMMAFLKKPAGKKLYLPYGIRLTTEYDRLILTAGQTVPCPFPPLEDTFYITIPGETLLPGWRVITAIVDKRVDTTDNGFSANLDLDKTGDRLLIRQRKPGDRFQPLGMSQQKKLQDFMVDARISQSWRSRIPVLCSPEQILWVVGWRIDDRVKVTSSTKRVLSMEFSRLP